MLPPYPYAVSIVNVELNEDMDFGHDSVNQKAHRAAKSVFVVLLQRLRGDLFRTPVAPTPSGGSRDGAESVKTGLKTCDSCLISD